MERQPHVGQVRGARLGLCEANLDPSPVEPLPSEGVFR